MTTSEIVTWGRGSAPTSRMRVAIDVRALGAHGFTTRDITHAPVGAVLVAADGTALRVTVAGALDPVVPFGFRSIASDPTARRRNCRAEP